MLLPLLIPALPLERPTTSILAVDGLVIGANTGKGWSVPKPSFGQMFKSVLFTPFGIGTVGKPQRAGLVYEEVDNGIYVTGNRSDTYPALLFGATPKAPRPVRSLPLDNPTYRKVCANFLAGQGVTPPKIRLTRILRTDLDGDGTDEVLIEASSQSGLNTMPEEAKAGTFSLVLLRSLKAGKVVETPLEFAVRRVKGTAELQAVDLKLVQAIADIDRDGRMEIVTGARGFEWQNATLWSYHKGLATKRVSNGAGH